MLWVRRFTLLGLILHVIAGLPLTVRMMWTCTLYDVRPQTFWFPRMNLIALYPFEEPVRLRPGKHPRLLQYHCY
jgi:hypothetical protein